MDPSFHPHDLDRLITDFTKRVPGIARALVVSSDGVPLAASARMQPDDLQKLAAITSGLIGLARGAAEVTDGGAFTQALVAMELGTLVIMAIDDGSSLAVLATAAADLDQVAYDMTMLAQQAGRAGETHPHQAGRAPAAPSVNLPRRKKPGSD